MIHTRICDLLGIPHPIILGGMGTATTAPLVAAVSNAGGFGTLGTSAFNAATLDSEIGAIRERTDKPYGVNHLLFQIQEDMFAVTLRPRHRSRPDALACEIGNLRQYGIMAVAFDDRLFEIRMDRRFRRGHEARAEEHAVGS